MENNILKLLKSKSKQDVLIGFNLLLAQSPDFIHSFFDKFYNSYGSGVKMIHFVTPAEIDNSNAYIMINENFGVTLFENGIRLRDIWSAGVCEHWQRITINEYLNETENI